MRSAKEYNELSPPKAVADVADEILEGELVDLLKRLRGCSSPNGLSNA